MISLLFDRSPGVKVVSTTYFANPSLVHRYRVLNAQNDRESLRQAHHLLEGLVEKFDRHLERLVEEHAHHYFGVRFARPTLVYMSNSEERMMKAAKERHGEEYPLDAICEREPIPVDGVDLE